MRWWIDLGAMPGNLKRLATTADAEADQRIKCPACATGRIGDLRYEPIPGGIGGDVGKCQDCGTWFRLHTSAKQVQNILNRPPHD